MKESILTNSQALFFKRGIKSVSIDDLADEMAMSKKTFYKFFPSKDELIKTLVENHIQNNIFQIEKIHVASRDAIEEMISICEFNCECNKALSPVFVNDIKRLYPSLWINIEDVMGKYILTCVKRNIERGQSEGFFRQDFHADFIAQMYQRGVFNLLDYFANQTSLSFSELNREYIAYHMHAIGTSLGTEKFKQIEI